MAMADVHNELIGELQSAVQTASRDYFLWSRGRVLYDDGVESLLPAYAAKQIFGLFGSLPNVTIRMERPIKDLQSDTTTGRFDLTVEFANQCTYAIECKRYANPASIKPDVDRLRAFSRSPDRLGLFVAPWYVADDQYAHPEQQDWPGSGLKWHVGPTRPLPLQFSHPQGWRSHLGVVIEVVG